MNILFFLKPKNEVAYIQKDFTLRQAMEKMEHCRFSAVPVIDAEGRYVDTLTEGDLLWFFKEHILQDIQEAENIPLTAVKRRWRNNAVNINCEIEDLILTSMNQNFVPVVDDKQIFIGIITRKAIIHHFYDEHKKGESGAV
ncbi:MAG: CBS domain-containing protein [Eubacteriales bacterium]|nr:CBS domain-containing protein [Eubacteriales bacterium]